MSETLDRADGLAVLVDRYLDGALSSEESAELNAALLADAAMRDLFVRLLIGDRTLAELHRRGDAIASAATTPRSAHPSPRRFPRYRALAAALLMAGAVVAFYFTTNREGTTDASPASGPVAALIDTDTTVYVDNAIATPGDVYTSGAYAIESGSAELMLYSRVGVGLHGNTRLVLHSPMHASLERGSADFDCPPSAKGFTVHLPEGSRIVDLGTAFAVSLHDDGEAELRVTEGSVRLELDPRDPSTHHVIAAGARVLIALAERSIRLERSGVAINVNFVNGVPQSGLTGPAGGLDETWNQLSTTSTTDLLDAEGHTTAVGFTSAGSGWGTVNRWGDASLAMIRDGHRTFDTKPETTWQELTITGLEPGDRYDVYLASAIIHRSQRSQGDWTVLNPSGSPAKQSVDNTARINGDSWERGNNYVLFEGVVVDDNGAIRLTGKLRRDSDHDTRLPLNGFQLRPTRDDANPTPTPDGGVGSTQKTQPHDAAGE